MYLKSIKAQGFKSFADPITIELENNITGVVGPNGSGKSNVVDAIRWVLGEQSIKSLRGEGTMTDIIFSGSKSRSGSSSAYVILTFDNKDRYFPFELDEINIKRRVFKDGTNEYYLNNEKVRLKDITSILMDSGMAKESFNIISQGKIEEILSSKPEERRVIFEEAAGVLKYKKRKEEAIRKLDRTHQNMARIGDIITELENQVEPLKEQKEKALEYTKVKEELEGLEIALVASDIHNLNFDYQKNKDQITILSDEISSISTSNQLGEAKIEEYKNSIDKIDEELKNKQSLLLSITTTIEQINSRKAIILERQKYKQEDTKYHEQLISLKEKDLLSSTEEETLKNKISNSQIEISNLQNELEVQTKKYQVIKNQKETIEEDLKNNLRQENSINIKLESLRYTIDNASSLPVSVKKVLDNPKLRGIHNVIGNLFDTNPDYSLAISTALGAATANVVLEDENAAKEAISFLKNNNIGRCTFFPLSVIKPRYIEQDVLSKLKNVDGFIGLASDLIQYDPKYKNILLNQLGNVIVVNSLDNANKIAKMINHMYRIVTVEGEILHVGGSLTGGKTNTSHNIILEKYELDRLYKESLQNIEFRKQLEEKGNHIDSELRAFEDRMYLINKDKMEHEMIVENLHNQLLKVVEEHKIINLDIQSMDHLLSNNISKEEDEILKEYYKVLEEKNALEVTLESLSKKRNSLKEQLDEYEYSLKKENGLYLEKSEQLKNLEIAVNRLDVKLDNLLNTLSETYNLTFEAAISKYKLDIPENIARTKVNSLKRSINEIGIVNLGAIEEYDRVATRYEFLVKQRDDLTKAENTLLDIIAEMDKVMEKEFSTTFQVIRENFSKTFKELFKGGTADLKLTDPSNLLETGIDIIASPPGKKLTTISLLSGGEKTFTAISLLFAILKSKPVPFCILDEVEAALDDNNVDSFGNYVRSLKDKTQFIIITHKKRTMEYVDILYGITMQESGVSKLVSVKLEELKS